MLMSVSTTSASPLCVQLSKGVLTVAREDEPHRAIPDFAPESLVDKQFEVRLVVDDENRVRHIHPSGNDFRPDVTAREGKKTRVGTPAYR